ncbi:hypothetical protein ACT453_21820, partial [Bacillus sp. D-CC]
ADSHGGISKEQLSDHVAALARLKEEGHQIVVNNLTWSVYLKMRPHYTTVGKLFTTIWWPC